LILIGAYWGATANLLAVRIGAWSLRLGMAKTTKLATAVLRFDRKGAARKALLGKPAVAPGA